MTIQNLGGKTTAFQLHSNKVVSATGAGTDAASAALTADLLDQYFLATVHDPEVDVAVTAYVPSAVGFAAVEV